MTENVLGPRKVGYWVHSGGVDPETGVPSFASKQRMYRLVSMLKNAQAKGMKPVVFFSGEPTRLSGGHQQAKVLADWKDLGGVPFHVFNVSMPEAFADICHYHADLDELHFINDDAYMSRYLWLFAKAGGRMNAKVKPVLIPVLSNEEYLERYSLEQIAANNAAAWLREALKVNGIWQFLLFGIDRAMNKPTKNPVKRALAKVVRALLRKNLR